jgi:hypothetical protein
MVITLVLGRCCSHEVPHDRAFCGYEPAGQFLREAPDRSLHSLNSRPDAAQ